MEMVLTSAGEPYRRWDIVKRGANMQPSALMAIDSCGIQHNSGFRVVTNMITEGCKQRREGHIGRNN
jgi:hypothetical protein